MQENKNLVEEALIQMKNVEEAIAENAKGILASTMKEEINQLVKESLSEQDEVDVDAEIEMPVSDDDEMDMDMDAEEGDMDVDMELDMDTEETPIDLTGASDEEILKVFKAMGEDDGIIVTKDDDEIHMTDNSSDSEYLIKLGESKSKTKINEDEELDNIISQLFDKDSSDMDSEESTDTEVEVDDFETEPMTEMGDDEVVYEISFDDEDDEDDDESEFMEEDDDSEEGESYHMEEGDDSEEEEESYHMEEDDDSDKLDETYNHKKSIKPKGVGIGKGPKFSFKTNGKGGFKEDMKQGNPKMGTGKPEFKYDMKGANLAGKTKKVETKEGDYGMNKGDKSKTHKGDEDYTTKKGDTLKRRAFEKEETKEASRTYGMGSKSGRGLRKGISNNRNLVFGKGGVKTESLEAEVSMLREKNEEYRKALNLFREKLNEVAIFNSNLAYATRLFTEHSTTKKEKINILRRFDSVETLKESKNLYKSIKDELSVGESKPITESVENKLNTTVSSGSAMNLIESKTYENPQFLRMKDLMSKIK